MDMKRRIRSRWRHLPHLSYGILSVGLVMLDVTTSSWRPRAMRSTIIVSMDSGMMSLFWQIYPKITSICIRRWKIMSRRSSSSLEVSINTGSEKISERYESWISTLNMLPTFFRKRSYWITSIHSDSPRQLRSELRICLFRKMDSHSMSGWHRHASISIRNSSESSM